MALAEIESQSGGEWIESLLLLTKLRCPKHGDIVLIQRKGGQIVFWCGCVRAGRVCEMPAADLRYEIVEVKR